MTLEVCLQEATHTAKRNERALYSAPNDSCVNFLQSFVDGMWFCELKILSTYYTLVTAIQIMTHLRDICSRINATDAVTIKVCIMYFYYKDWGITQYINMLEESQATDAHAGHPIIENLFITLDNQAIIAAGDYLEETKVLNKHPSNERTWEKWKPTYLNIYTATQKSVDMRNK